jgi:hypothetical protein
LLTAECRLQRIFHRPTGLQPLDVLYLCLHAWPVSIDIQLNGLLLEHDVESANQTRVRLGTLQPTNYLTVMPSTSGQSIPASESSLSDASDSAELAGFVWLEIVPAGGQQEVVK